MTATLPVEITFSLPGGWRSVDPEEAGAPNVAFVALHPDSAEGGFMANITISGDMRLDDATVEEIAAEAVPRLEQLGTVRVLQRADLGEKGFGAAGAPGVIQELEIDTVLHGRPVVLCQSQVHVEMDDVQNPDRRAVLEFVLTARREQLDEVLEGYREFLETVRPT